MVVLLDGATKRVRKYYRSGTDRRCCIGAGRHFVFINQVAALCCLKWRRGRHLESVTSTRKFDFANRGAFLNFVKNMSAKFHPDPIGNDGAFGFFEDGRRWCRLKNVEILFLILIHQRISIFDCSQTQSILSFPAMWITIPVFSILASPSSHRNFKLSSF